MHVLLTNDDGPLNDATSPYIKYLVDAIEQNTDWKLSIVVPHQQRSWIGKAHFAGQTLTASYIYPTGEGNSYNGPFNLPQKNEKNQEWCLIDGTPASCTDVGIHHLYKEKGPVDLVISGPNFGRNSSALYIMSSGTLGAAMEASLTGKKAVGLSYSFDTTDTDPKILQEAALVSVKLVQHLYNNWPKDTSVDLYSINVPLVDSLKLNQTKIFYAPIWQNKWGSIYTEIDNEAKANQDIIDRTINDKIQFKWTPDFMHVHKETLKITEHNDSRVLRDEGISVTPLKATFLEAQISGEIKLDSTLPNVTSLALSDSDKILLSIPKDSYIYPALEEAIAKNLPGMEITSELSTVEGDFEGKVFHFGDYEELNFDKVMMNTNYLVCSYIYRKALIRKHYLAHTIHSYVSKNPNSILTKAFPQTYQLEVDYAEFLDEALDDAYELRDEIESGEKTWILKPSMSDRGQGIRLFKTVDQLQEIFDGFEELSDDEEGDDTNNGVITSQLRHFVVQEYMENPLLLPAYDNKKFHFRCYVMSNGAIEVFVYKRMLTLFALSKYEKPTTNDDDEIALYGHLTNTCLQGEEAIENNSVVEFWQLEGLNEADKKSIFDQICEIVAELFKAAVNIDRMNFQPIPNAFEIYGLDFLVDEALEVKLLEVNAYPDFKQTGDELKGLIYELFDGVIKTSVVPFFTQQSQKSEENLIKVLDESTSGGW